MPLSRRTSGGQGSVSGARATTQHGGDTGIQRVLDLLRADEVDVRVDTAGRYNLAFTRDHLGTRADNDVHTRLDIRIAGLADTCDEAIADADVGFYDTPVIQYHGVGDDGIHGTR